MEEVCIIGGGLSGILSAKISLSHNLIPVVFEKSPNPCGVWLPDSPNIGIWNSLKTNLSKFMMSISDHLWPNDCPVFPSGLQVYEYFTSYISKHSLLQYFQLNTTVLHLDKEDDHYTVTYKNSEGTFTRTFKYVLIATGLFSKPNDSIKNKEAFNGVVLDAGYYRNPSVFTGKKVAVVGMSFSATDIAYEALQTAESVTQIYRSKVIFSRRFINQMPNDFFLFNFGNKDKKPVLDYTIESNTESCHIINQIFGNPGEITEEWRISDEEIRSRFVNFSLSSDEYFEAIKQGQIKLVRGDAVEYCENGVKLADGQIVEADIIVSATGYFVNFEFLGEKLREILKYDPNDKKLPVLLFRGCLHPSLPGLAFVGKVYSLFTSSYELTAEIGVKWIKGLLNLTDEELWEGVRFEERLKTEARNALFCYDFLSIQSELFRILGIEIDYKMLERLEYTKGPHLAALFFNQREEREERIQEFIRQIKETVPNFTYN